MEHGGCSTQRVGLCVEGAQTGHFLLHLHPTDVMEMRPLVHSVEQGPGLRADGDVQM